jgi:VanZ family protein
MFRFLSIRRLFFVLAAAAWTTIIPALSLLPACFFSGAAHMGRIPGMDKIVHALIYGIQTALLIGAWRSFRPCGPDRVLACAGAASAYGFLMEVLQRILTTSRQFSWGDMAANLLGALVVAGLSLPVSALRRVRGTDPAD